MAQINVLFAALNLACIFIILLDKPRRYRTCIVGWGEGGGVVGCKVDWQNPYPLLSFQSQMENIK